MADMEKAKALREAMNLEKTPVQVAPGADLTQVTRAPTVNDVQRSPRPVKGLNRQQETNIIGVGQQAETAPFSNRYDNSNAEARKHAVAVMLGARSEADEKASSDYQQ